MTVSLLFFVLFTFLVPFATSSHARTDDISIALNGTFIHNSPVEKAKAHSPNGLFWCTYTVGRVGDEVRELEEFEFYLEDQLLFTMDRVPGSDLLISNKGFMAFMDMTHHYRGELSIHIYSDEGRHLFSKTYQNTQGFKFSPDGNRFGIRSSGRLHVVTIPEQKTEVYPSGRQFGFSEDGGIIAIGTADRIRIHSDGDLLNQIEGDFGYPRKLAISSENDLVAVINKRNIYVYSLSAGDLLFTDRVTGNYSFRDLSVDGKMIHAGIHHRGDGISEGIIRTYDLEGNKVGWETGDSRSYEVFHDPVEVLSHRVAVQFYPNYDPIPWPFVPFDEMHTVWNYFEQHMGYGGDWSYLHQGLDMIVPIDEPTYAVAPGIVKCVLTISGQYHWRIAISPVQEEGWSDGWLYAHLVEETIQFDVGDTVQLHDYLGDIIEWTEDWGHIHFVEIADSGLVWEYEDNEWGINFNPLRALNPDTDLSPPFIDTVFTDSKFGFCRNETSNYLDPDSLYGDIDIITKVVDYIGESIWQQPAFETYYWVENLSEGDVVFPRTLGHTLNHAYPFYSSGNYEPYATVIYKGDAILPASYWEETERNFYHVLTNSDGDSLIDLSEKDLAFSTYLYPDGEYRIFVEVFDEYGNSSVDSMDVWFKNEASGVDDGSRRIPLLFDVAQNYPNPFNPETSISYQVPGPPGTAQHVKLSIHDCRGRLIRVLADSDMAPGNHKVVWDGNSGRGEPVTSGIYFYTFQLGDTVVTKKMTLLK